MQSVSLIITVDAAGPWNSAAISHQAINKSGAE